MKQVKKEDLLKNNYLGALIDVLYEADGVVRAVDMDVMIKNKYPKLEALAIANGRPERSGFGIPALKITLALVVDVGLVRTYKVGHSRYYKFIK